MNKFFAALCFFMAGANFAAMLFRIETGDPAAWRSALVFAANLVMAIVLLRDLQPRRA